MGVAGGDTRAEERIRQARLADVEAAIDTSFALEVVGDLAAIGASDLGFRVSGTPEDDAACALVAERMAAVGLQVALEAVPVDAWRFGGASLTVGSEVMQCSSFGGVPGTPPGGLEGDLVYVGEGTRGELAGLDLVGRIALFDWRGDQLFWPSATAAELGRAGALAVVCTCLHGGRYYQGERALGSFDAMWLAGSPPLAYLVREDAEQLIARLRARETLSARVVIDAQLIRGATGHNVVGVLPGRSQEAPIVIGAHHDCWFAAAFDDATGVAATLAIAKALGDTGYEPEQPIVFTSHTAEEYGRADAAFDWLIGAWWQIEREHPEWARRCGAVREHRGHGHGLPHGCRLATRAAPLRSSRARPRPAGRVCCGTGTPGESRAPERSSGRSPPPACPASGSPTRSRSTCVSRTTRSTTASSSSIRPASPMPFACTRGS